MAGEKSVHASVLAQEVLRWLDPQAGDVLVDGTLGGGGHTRLLAEAVGPTGLVIAFDRDPRALAAAERNLAGMPVKLAHANFSEMAAVLDSEATGPVKGILLDLGLSSDQLADASRGFSFLAEGPLDLRFDPTEGAPASQLVNRLGEKELADVIYRYGEERFSRRIARRIVERRKTKPIETAGELAELVRGCVPRSRGHAIDPATRTFQALRIAVNRELESLETTLRVIPDILAPGGRAAVISFHSLEDRLVKTAFRDDPRYDALTRKPIRPSEEEIRRNPRSRSARLRVAARR
ncbi:MAG: 16S rRNA (cytosine(1402)-N(4))-methyltransferase RsmH [Planctomycetes bacterium]|nr:16S rRNA (cytosine(1402)-N(4))-methyltransferase RsmH [Planctomycetota bacterium]